MPQWPCSIPANRDDRRLADSKQLRIGILHANPNGIARRQVHPVKGPLYVGQPLFQLSDDIGIGSNSKTYAVHHTQAALEGQIRCCSRILQLWSPQPPSAEGVEVQIGQAR